jgi:transcriptional regulator with XRE-family HTH domain
MFILHVKIALSREKLQISKKSFGRVLRRLREDVLKIKTQLEMAQRVGVSVYSYQNWELGRSLPDGMELLRVLWLCPDAESLALFGLYFTPRVIDNKK